jgi:lipopolysaccharide/colanic/teichoic acid biosynthesis glycosyltransferase
VAAGEWADLLAIDGRATFNGMGNRVAALCGKVGCQTQKISIQYDDRLRQRLLVKPGISGPMQVNGRGNLDMEARLALELDYIQHYSLWKDIVILLRTISAVISGKGAY